MIEPALRSRGIEFDYADLYAADHPPSDPAGYDALIFMGGPMSVNDDLAYLRREEAYIREALQQQKPVLGVCLGSQLIARALGAQVRRNPVKEIGWFPIQLTEAGRCDSLFTCFREPEVVFHWHGETFDLPTGAELLAVSDRCRYQAYRVGTDVYGLQFHLEVTPEMIAGWCSEDENCGDVGELDAPVDAGAHSARMQELSRAVFGRWCDIVLYHTSYRG
jgi:GMP synthase-like glutamine amidotransferase